MTSNSFTCLQQPGQEHQSLICAATSPIGFQPSLPLAKGLVSTEFPAAEAAHHFGVAPTDEGYGFGLDGQHLQQPHVSPPEVINFRSEQSTAHQRRNSADSSSNPCTPYAPYDPFINVVDQGSYLPLVESLCPAYDSFGGQHGVQDPFGVMASGWSVRGDAGFGSTGVDQGCQQQANNNNSGDAIMTTLTMSTTETTEWGPHHTTEAGAVCTNGETVLEYTHHVGSSNAIRNKDRNSRRVVRPRKGYQWHAERLRPHYSSVTGDSNGIGPFPVRLGYTPSSCCIDEITINAGDELMVHLAIDDGWCFGTKRSAPRAYGFFPVACISLSPSLPLHCVDNGNAATFPKLRALWHRFSHRTKWPRKQSFQCVACGNEALFKCRKTLNRHLRTSEKHSPRRPHQCSECRKSFARLDACTRHKNRTHRSAAMPH